MKRFVRNTHNKALEIDAQTERRYKLIGVGRVIRLLLFQFLFFSCLAEAGTPTVPQGVWQPSYAFLGKMDWDKNYLIVRHNSIIIERSGVVSETYSYKGIDSLSFPAIAISALKIWVFEPNEKFGCEPKSKLKYDRNCTQQNQRKGFNLFECKSIDLVAGLKNNCSIIDSYYSFDERELIKLSEISKNL